MWQHEVGEKERELEELKAAAQRVDLQRVPVFRRVPTVIEVVFVRHGQAEHNVYAAKWRQDGKPGSPYLIENGCPVDADLTPQGIQEAQNAGEALRSVCNGKANVVAAISTMRRTLQTWKYANFPFLRSVAVDSVRERWGKNVCDSQRAYDRVGEFPGVDFSNALPVEQDPAVPLTDREPYEDLLRRAERFIRQDLPKLNANVVVVFSHSSFLLALFNGVLQADAELSKPFVNGEVRVTHIAI